MKIREIFKRAIPFALIAVILIAAAFRPQPPEEEPPRVVRVWNVDTFEGGQGSRTAFLKSAARRVEKSREGVYYLVTSLTREGALAAFQKGETPDMLSFGVGLSVCAESALPLPERFRGGETGGERLAYPWCRGGYALFSLGGFEEEGSVAISCGGSNLPEAAAALAGIEGEVLPALSAYSAFLGGTYRYLLGTQRDLCRFRARGVSVEYRPLPAFCDLFQYISVLSAVKREDCLALLDELGSDRTREALSSIGMFPPDSPDPFAPLPQSTVEVFASDEALGTIRDAAKSGRKNLEKYLKSI